MPDRARRPYSGDPEADAFIAQDPLALHRFPGAMASRVRELCAAIVRDHAGDAARPWSSADAATVRRGLLELPGIDEMDAGTILSVPVRLGVPLAGPEAVLPILPTLGDVDSPEALAVYRAGAPGRGSARGEKGRIAVTAGAGARPCRVRWPAWRGVGTVADRV